MKDSRTTSTVILPFPSVRDATLTLDDFEKAAAKYLAGKLPAQDFLPLCNEALRVVGNYKYKKSVYQYRFLAQVALGQYFDATADAFVILASFHDAMRHFEMMCTLCLRRSNYFKALDYVDKLMLAAEQEGLDPESYREERDSLAAFTRKIPCLSAIELASAFAADENIAAKRFRGVPIMLSGRGWVGVNQESRTRFLTFQNTGDLSVRCRFHRNEAPFLRNIITGQHVRVTGYFAFTANGAVYLDPCYLAV